MSEAAIDQRESPPLAETPDIYGAYPRLSDDQIATLEAGGARRAVKAGETLVREGERSDYFFVILSGKVAVTTTDDEGNRHVIRVHGPGRFLGEMGDLEGQAAFYTAEAVEPGALPCRPCDQRLCAPGDFRCLRQITPQEVVTVAERALARARDGLSAGAAAPAAAPTAPPTTASPTAAASASGR